MKIIRRGICLALASFLVVAMAACNNASTPKAPENNSQNTSSSDTASYRKPYVSSETVETKRQLPDTDGDFDFEVVDWAGPKGYVIVVPAKDDAAREVAVYLQDYYTRKHGVTLQIVTDAVKETAKEILIGNTNRSQSKHSLTEGQLEAALDGDKLVFKGGHAVTVEAAVKRFTRLFPELNEALTFKLDTDFTSTPSVDGLEDYKFVWGDEFEDWYDLDFGRWNFRAGMSGSASAIIARDRDVIDVGDGRLKIHAINHYDPNSPEVLFKMPWSTATNETMNFLYGYAEIRAKVPFFEGTWPSFWGGTATAVYPRDTRWHAEVDVFEIFGTADTVVPNIHKWYDDYPYEEIYNTDGVRHTTYGKMEGRPAKYELKHYVYKNYENLNNEYHTYGYEWTPTEMSFYVDGEKYCTMDIVNSWDLEPDMSMFQEPQYSQFNSHVFVNDGSFTPNLIYGNMELLPSEYYIDYYRLYQKNDGKSKIWLDTSKRYTEQEVRRKDLAEFTRKGEES